MRVKYELRFPSSIINFLLFKLLNKTLF